MKKLTFVFLFSLLLLCGCKGCLNNFYAVHEPADLDIVYIDKNIKPKQLRVYIDSVIGNDTADYEIITTLSGDTLNNKQRIIHFKKSPEEFYRVSINGEPCWIISISNKKWGINNWVYDPNKLKSNELLRIRKRFEKEVLDKVH